MSKPGSEPSTIQTRRFDWDGVHRRLEQLRQKLAGAEAPSPEDRARILQQRARELARAAAAPAATEEPLEYVVFALGPERYGLELKFLREIVGLKEIIPVPGVPGFVAGIFNLRGHIVSVVDLKRRLELPSVGLSDFHTVLVLRSPEMEFGLLVDRVLGTQQVPPGRLQQRLPVLNQAGRRYFSGITPEQIILLDAAAILGDPALLVEQALGAP